MEIFKLSPQNYKKALKTVVPAMKKGEVIVCPTDTVYGLICDATSKKAVQKLFKIKKRSARKPIPIFVKDIKMAKKFAFINKNQEKFLKKVWFTPHRICLPRREFILLRGSSAGPGKVTAVLKRKDRLPKLLFGKAKTMGLRIPNYKLVNNLLKKLNRPLTGTSANISGKPASTKIREVLKQFKNQKHQPDLILDSGNLKPSKPSTVIDLTSIKPKILRIGGVTKKELLKI